LQSSTFCENLQSTTCNSVDFSPVEDSAEASPESPVKPRKYRTDNGGCWPYDPEQLMRDALAGKVKLTDEELQSVFFDWMSSIDYNLFRNTETGDDYYAMCCKRGNVVYATRKTNKEKEIREALEGKEFDYPVEGCGRRRMTRFLLVTLNFDRERFTAEEAWASLRSTPIEGTDYIYNVINKFNANISKIFGPHGTLVCKEGQSSGYPAPHLIFLLDEPVMVEYHETHGKGSWRICDSAILERIGKGPKLRRLAFKDHRKAIQFNPIWKYGFCDFEGIVTSGSSERRNNPISYVFKYLTKCLTDPEDSKIAKYKSINEIEDKALRTAMFTHLANKCFGTRDITFGKGFKERLEMLPAAKPVSSPWKRIRTLTDSEHDLILELKERRAVKQFRTICLGLGAMTDAAQT